MLRLSSKFCCMYLGSGAGGVLGRPMHVYTHSSAFAFAHPTRRMPPHHTYQKNQKTMMVFLCTSTLQENYGMGSLRRPSATLQPAACSSICCMRRKRRTSLDRDQISNSNFTPRRVGHGVFGQFLGRRCFRPPFHSLNV